jgi:hypothetical protein
MSFFGFFEFFFNVKKTTRLFFLLQREKKILFFPPLLAINNKFLLFLSPYKLYNHMKKIFEVKNNYPIFI